MSPSTHAAAVEADLAVVEHLLQAHLTALVRTPCVAPASLRQKTMCLTPASLKQNAIV